MCGILAYFNRDGISDGRLNEAMKSLKSIRHRGPDGEGILLINTKTGQVNHLITEETPSEIRAKGISLQQAAELNFDLILGHRRLSIIDVSVNGHQPMCYQEDHWVIFNGEIYNYIELRVELKNSGYQFTTETDTEVILAAYKAWGEACFSKFNGMFSILIYDSRTRKLITANDRFGVKPLYLYQSEKELLLVSEIKQAFDFKIDTAINGNAVSSFLEYNFLDYDSNTFLKQVQRHPAAHYAVTDLNQTTTLVPKRYYEVKFSTHKKSADVYEEFRDLLTSSVKLRLRSDVPVGFASSGGLDSSAVLYTAHRLLKKESSAANINTFSAVFPGEYGDESYFINLVENDLKIKSHYINPLNEFSVSDFEKHIYHMDSPVTSTSFYAGWCVAKMVREKKVIVLLVGQGADEILAGYHHHFYRYGRQIILSGRIFKYLELAKKYADLKGISVNTLHKTIMNEVKLSLKFKAGLADLGNNLANKWNRADKLIQLLKTDLTETAIPFYVKADDRNGMAFSIESRHPFLDYRLVDFCFSLPDHYKINNGWQKHLIRQAMHEMPSEIRFRKDKKGFTTPQEKWINSNKESFESYLNYLPEQYKKSKADIFNKYALGAWFKVNKLQPNV
jgi:asparagine synthase (glutamine-hydrolysing)